jgi:hypothetical protein
MRMKVIYLLAPVRCLRGFQKTAKKIVDTSMFSDCFQFVAVNNIYRFLTMVINTTITILDIIHRPVFYLKLSSTL